MKTIEIFDEENSIIEDDEYDVTTYEIFPETKKFTINTSVKDDCFFTNLTYEYRISTIPIGIQTRLLEKSYEPPYKNEVKDGVVLESEILKDSANFVIKSAESTISELKKAIEWTDVNVLGNYQVNLYILSKHPEIISVEEYRRFLRQSLEKIKTGVLKIENVVKNDSHGLEIIKGKYGKSIWYPSYESEKKDANEYYDLPEEKRKGTDYGRKLEYIEKLNEDLFKENSSKYVGILEYEFRHSGELVEYIEKVLENKHISSTKKGGVETKNNTGQKMKWAIVIILSIIALSWGVWTAIGIFLLGAIIISVLSR